VARVDVAKELQLAHKDFEELLKLIRVACVVPASKRLLWLGHGSLS
jgi:hypothetical protein